MNEMKWYLFDPESKEKISLGGIDVFSVGRANSNDLPINDQSISNRHAKIFIKDNRYFVHDFNSFNSTYVNGKEIPPEKDIKLKIRDVVQFGDKVFYFSSTDANQAFLDLPSMTDSFQLSLHNTQDVIVHNYEEPIVNLEEQIRKSTSLKSLRAQKDDIDSLKQQLKEAENGQKNREKCRRLASKRAQELDEFNSYLAAKGYDSESKIQATIESIIEVNERLMLDKKKIEENIYELEAQILDLKKEANSFIKEKKTNEAVIDELKNDIEILKGRDGIESELSDMYKKIRGWDKEDITQQITMIKVLIDEKEKEFKKVQKDYADARFGQSTAFGAKKAS